MEIKAKNIARNSIGIAVVLMVGILSLTSCHKRLEPTAIQIDDSIRHYPATILGDDLEMVYVVRNIGKDMLMISDIQPAVPTIEVDKANVDMIPPGEEAALKFIYHSDKNIGLARHIIRIFGNIYPSGVAQIIFDTHVVRPSIDLSDYVRVPLNRIQLSVAAHGNRGDMPVHHSSFVLNYLSKPFVKYHLYFVVAH